MRNFLMNKLDLLRLARQNLWRRKMRTFLTVLGVLIGTTSIVVMLSLGIGLGEEQRKSMEQWGSLTMIEVNRGMVFDEKGEPVGEAKELNDEAVEEIKEIPGVTVVSPAYNLHGEARMGRKEGGLQLVGLAPELMDQLEFKASEGRLLQGGDRNVLVVGQRVIDNFWDESERRAMARGMRGPGRREEKDPSEMMEQRIALTVHNNNNYEKKRKFNFTVVGILEGEYGQHSWQAYAPLEDLQRIRKFMLEGAKSRSDDGNFSQGGVMTGGTVRVERVGRSRSNSRDTDNYDYLLVRTAGIEHTSQVSEVLRDKGYNSWSMADNLEGFEKTSRTIQAVLGGIGAITLLVAAIGITNTMIMSIYERTKEIGVMKVIGAAFSDIYSLFLTEAGMIGFLGGVFGLGLSYGASHLINHLVRNYISGGMPMEEVVNISLIPPWLALFALVFSILIGVVAGLYPAHRAVRLSPIKAIRNE
jgi:putative ABC transport system permease protein